MKLTESDYKLLSYLYHNNREPITKIAKACKLTREQVDYKIKKYVSSGLIKGFFTFFDYTKFGYNSLVVLFVKLKNHSYLKNFTEKLDKSENCISYGKVFGKYDLFMNSIFKDEKELGDYLADLISEEHIISDYFVLKPYFTELYPVKFFQHKKIDSFVWTSESSKRKFDDKEIKIMKILANDARVRVIDLAKKLNISAELVVYKMKKLRYEQVVIGSRIQFNMQELGHYFSVLMMNIKDFSRERQEKMKQFARNSRHIHSANFQLTKPNCIIQVFHKGEEELRDTIEKIEEKFGNLEIDIEVIPIGEDEGRAKTLPFLK